jgi:GNAT superfamily N-acetyltransferase
MNETILFRKATLDDFYELSRLRWDYSHEETDRESHSFDLFTKQFKIYLEDSISSGNSHIWVAELDGKLVSNLYLEIVRKVPRPWQIQRAWGYITNVYTMPDYRGQNIARKLMEHAILESKHLGLDSIMLWPSEKSIAFYERLGFRNLDDCYELGF